MAKQRTAAYFNKLFLTITFTATLIICLISAFLYYNFKSYSLEALNIANEKLMNQVFQNALQHSNYASDFASTLFRQSAAIELMVGDQISVFDHYNNQRRLDILLRTTPVYSAYLYNGTSQTIYTLGSDVLTRTVDDFYDQEIVGMILQKNTESVTPIPRTIPDSELNPRPLNVYSYIYKQLSARSGKVQYAVVVNVKVELIFNTLLTYSQTNSQRGNHFLIINAQGNVVADSENKLFGDDLSQLPYIQQVMQAGSSSGYFSAKVSGEPSVITYSGNNSTDWLLISITPYKYISAPINKVKTITLSVSSVMVIACLIAAYFLARNLYQPIGRLRSTIDQLPGIAKQANKEDEFEALSRTFINTHSQLHKLDSFRKSNMHVLKQNLLLNILKQAVPGNYERMFEEYQIHVEPHESLLLMLLKIDHYTEDFCNRYNENDQALMKYAMMNIAEEIAGQGACVDMGGDHIVMLLNVKGNPDELSDQNSLAREIQSSLLHFRAISVSVFTSQVTNTIHEASMLYSEVVHLSRYRLRYGHGCVLHARNADSHGQSYKMNPALLDKLSDSIKKGRSEPMMEAYREWATSLENMSYNEIMYSLSVMTTEIFQTLSYMEKNTSINFELDYVTFDQQIKATETLEQIHAEYEQLFIRISTLITSNKDQHSTIVVQNAQKYIHQHYQDSSLSTRMVADHVHMTTSHLGKLFREQIAQSIADYVTKVRLEKACELLRETAYTVDEIVHHIGWVNKKYFFVIFKKTFGATPTEYRLNTSHGDEHA